MKAKRTLTVEQAWALFQLGASTGGDPGWQGGLGLNDMRDDPGTSSQEQIDIRSSQRIIFLRWWESASA
jgi:hypothetical protein